jgi:hypothetical protein
MNIYGLVKMLDDRFPMVKANELVSILLESDLSKIKYLSVSFKLLSNMKARLYTNIIYDDFPALYASTSLDKSECIFILNTLNSMEFPSMLDTYSDTMSFDAVNFKECVLYEDGHPTISKYGALLTLLYGDRLSTLFIKPSNLIKLKEDLCRAERYDLLMLLEG